ncbi:cellulose binding domain-containing protein [Catenuloplanes atrovinosus]|uniref:CBM2 domain-containing protein n=1 Tax=Catenuloplanes atrovinosus TaxID=137266 RepID=A0AAE3YU29_9ACTN|nr:cellulose binding domain-containing protein [Catenuloplanes atrovinosus]MDR7278635.1 hypothetical protein [Catenuloplanes atrovinosus]
MPWVPVLGVVVVVTGLLVAALTLVPFDAAQQAATPSGADEPVTPSDPGPGSPELSRVPGLGVPTPSGVGETSLIAGTEAPGRQLTDASGTYRVLNSYGDSFIAEVLITNPTTGVRHWSLQIEFEDNVGELHTFWVESAPQATMSRDGALYTFISTVPLSAGASVSLRLQFNRTGEDAPPRLCTVNGATCGIA